jgi:hypothetical protein
MEQAMSRYHFNVYDSATTIDPEGMQLPDIRAARHEGFMRAAAMIMQEADKSTLDYGWCMEITDGRGMVLIRLDFSESYSAATRPSVTTT